jgi:hypothetical protein
MNEIMPNHPTRPVIKVVLAKCRLMQLRQRLALDGSAEPHDQGADVLTKGDVLGGRERAAALATIGALSGQRRREWSLL